jgi:WD40 repeat protein
MTNKALTADTKATSHPCYVANIKGCNNEVTAVAWSANGERAVVSCVDCTIRVYTAEGVEGGKGALATAKTTGGDHVTACDFSYDGQEIVCAMDGSRKLRRYSITGNNMAQKFESSDALHRYPVKWLHSSKGKWVATLSEEDETSVKFWDYDGKLLKDIDLKQVKCYSLVASLNGKFLGSAAWSPGVKVIEVKAVRHNNSPGVFASADHAMSLPSQKGLTALAFNADATRAVTAQKDGQLAVWRTDVRYEVNEDPKKVVEREFDGVTWQALAVHGNRLLAAAGGAIHFFDLDTLNRTEEPVESAHRSAVFTIAPHPEKPLVLSAARDATPRCWRVPS